MSQPLLPLSREKKRAQGRVVQFQSSEKRDWDRFTDNTARKSFVKQLGADPMTDPKLLQYADSMNRLKTGKKIADIPGDGGKSYQITKLRGSERLGCTCNDWRYKKSVAQPGEAQDCKHIQQFREMSKTAAARFQDNLPNPVIDGKPHDGTWTIVGSGRLSIPKKTSDIDYMVPLEEIGDLSSFNEYKDVPGAYWKDLDPVKGRPATVVAVPRYAYDKIDASYQQAVDRFGKRKLRHLKKTLPKDSFYKDIGVVYTSDAMKKEAGHTEDRIAERAPKEGSAPQYDRNVYVTGHSGSGKSTLAKQLAEERGLPIFELDKTPEIRDFLEQQKKHFRATGSLGLEQTRERERAALRQALSKIKDPHIVEGSYFLSNTDLLPNESEVYLVDRPVDVILKQRVERTVAKDIERGRQPDPERPRRLGIELIQHYHPGVEELRKRPGVKTFGQLKKLAGHVEDRIAERAPGAEPEVNTLRAKLRNMKLRKGQTYHIPLKRGRGYAVVGDVGDRHVVKTVLGPSMRPPGERLKVARAPRDYRKEYDEYHAKPEQVENRSLRNQARRKLGLKKGDPREADHKTPLSKGGGNGHSNLRAVSRKTNRTKFTDPA